MGPDPTLASPSGAGAVIPTISAALIIAFVAVMLWKAFASPMIESSQRARITGSDNPFDLFGSDAASSADKPADDSATNNDAEPADDGAPAEDEPPPIELWQVDISEKPEGAVIPDTFDFSIYGAPPPAAAATDSE